MTGPDGGGAGAANISRLSSDAGEGLRCERKLLDEVGTLFEDLELNGRTPPAIDALIASIGKVLPGIATISSVATSCRTTTIRDIRLICVAFVRPDTPTGGLLKKSPRSRAWPNYF